MGQRLESIKQARDLATEIVETGASLYSSLGKEEELKQSRDRALAFIDSISKVKKTFIGVIRIFGYTQTQTSVFNSFVRSASQAVHSCEHSPPRCL